MVVRPATIRKWVKKSPRRRACRALTVTNPAHIRVREDGVLVPVEQLPGLVDEGWGETVCIGLVVGQLCVDVVVDVPLFKKRDQIT